MAVDRAAPPRPPDEPRTGTGDPPDGSACLIAVEGIVQGVGFRPFVYRLAGELGLDGRVRNTAGRVEIEVAGPPERLREFAARLRSDAPPRSRVERVTVAGLHAAVVAPRRGDGFRIEESRAEPSAERLFPPDIATCDDCLRELFDPTDRRYRYPFINCTNCGPRATIIDALPYDRAATSMREFPLCPSCAAEYRDPSNRRFHAEPVACPVCGPQLTYRRTGEPAPRSHGDEALQAALVDLRAGRIVAVKGLGGYHLACDATDERAVARLRDRKRRWAKPFAVMVRDLAAARRLARVAPAEARLLTSPERPIVLLRLRRGGDAGRPGDAGRTNDAEQTNGAGQPNDAERPNEALVAPGVCNGDLRVGLFLPYTPLHHLLLEGIDRPIVLTSGNLSDEPLATDDADALDRLAGLADAFLQHDREIRARYDDSVTRVVRGSPSIVRRARGYAPDPLPLPVAAGEPLLAAGAELKHTFTLARAGRAHVGPHTGDLEDLLTHRAFEENLAHLSRLLDLEPRLVAHDGHPGYLSTQFAAARFPAERRIAVQHHHAHVASCAAEHGLTGPVIGVAYDGLGMGDDGTLWGGEVLIADLVGYRRFARFGLAPMPGGALAIRRPYRMALGYLFGTESDGLDDGPGGDGLAESFLARLDPREVQLVRAQMARHLNAPLTSSAGRLFDAVSSLLGLRDVAEYEAQAAVDVETAAGRWGARAAQPLPYRIWRRDGILVYDPRPTLAALLGRLTEGTQVGALAADFHETVDHVTRELCDAARGATGIETVCLSGGVFQNQRLADTLLRRLARDGFDVRINRQVPVNDGGISYGQAAVAAARLAALPRDGVVAG